MPGKDDEYDELISNRARGSIVFLLAERGPAGLPDLMQPSDLMANDNGRDSSGVEAGGFLPRDFVVLDM